MKYNAETATQFTSSFVSMDQTTLLSEISGMGKNLDELADTVGGILCGIARLPKIEQEDVIWALFNIANNTFGINVDQLVLNLTKYSQNTVKYNRKEGTIKRRKSNSAMVLRLTPLQAMTWRDLAAPGKTAKPQDFTLDSVTKSLDKITAKVSESESLSTTDLVHKLRMYADELAESIEDSEETTTATPIRAVG